jgi:hypothetical protein
MKTRCVSYVLTTAIAALSAGTLQAEQVWSPEYESYIDADFEQHVVCARPQGSSSELVWDDRYEAYVPRDMPQHVIEASVPEEFTGANELVWFPEYEQYLPQNIARHTIEAGVSCPIG